MSVKAKHLLIIGLDGSGKTTMIKAYAKSAVTIISKFKFRLLQKSLFYQLNSLTLKTYHFLEQILLVSFTIYQVKVNSETHGLIIMPK